VKEIEQYKHNLSRSLKFVAPIALPPLVPLSWGETITDLAPLYPRVYPPCHSLALKTVNNTLYLAVLDKEGESVFPASSGKAPVEDLAVPGFFIMNLKADSLDNISDISSPPKMGWKVWEVSDFRLIIQNKESWWNDVYLEEQISKVD